MKNKPDSSAFQLSTKGQVFGLMNQDHPTAQVQLSKSDWSTANIPNIISKMKNSFKLKACYYYENECALKDKAVF